MKVKSVIANNRKKAFEVTTSSRRTFEFPYSKLRLKPSEKKPITKVYPDTEIGLDGFTYELASGEEDTIVIDQLLEYARDPEYIRRALLFKLTMEANSRLDELDISKREVMRRMGVAATQFYRLMDPQCTHKTIDQMVRLLTALDLPVDVIIPKPGTGEAA